MISGIQKLIVNTDKRIEIEIFFQPHLKTHSVTLRVVVE